jgi:hypothetical protein
VQTEDIYENLDSRRLNASQLADLILADPKVIGLVVDGLRQDSPVVRTTSAKALRNVSREKPRMLLPLVQFFRDSTKFGEFFCQDRTHLRFG